MPPPFSRFLSVDSLIYIVILLGILVRLINLDADPYSRIWIGFITDEGFWNSNARNTLLFGKPFFDFTNLHFFLAPIFQSINYLVFLALDISYSTARIFPALSGALIIILYFRYFKNILSQESIFFGVTFLAFQPDLLMLSRISIPESPLMLVELLLFFLITHPNRSPSIYVLFALVLLFGIGVKATFIPLSIILTCALLATPANGHHSDFFLIKYRKTFLYFAGIGLFFVIILAGLLSYWDQEHITSNPVSVIFLYLKLNSLYSILSFPFYAPIAPTFNFLALGVWFSLVAWLHLDKNNNRGFRLHQLYVPAAIWCVLYLVLMIILGYFPERYKVHIFIPMIIMITIGISILQELGFDNILRSISENFSWNLFGKIALYILPSSILFAVLIKNGLQSGFGFADRFLLRLLCIGISFTVLFAATVRFRHRKSFVGFLFIFPSIAVAIWYFSYHIQENFPFWLPNGHPSYSILWMVIFASSFGLSVLFSISLEKNRRFSVDSVCNLFSTMLLATFLVWVVPLYSNPRFTMRDTSRDLGELLQDSTSVGILNAYGLFLENDVEYMPQMVTERFLYPHHIVSVFEGPHVEAVKHELDDYYSETQVYYLDTYPYLDGYSSKAKVTVYTKIMDPT